MEKRIGIITATDCESAALQALLTEKEAVPGPAGLTFWRGHLEGRPVVAVQAGIGKVNAALCTQAFIDSMHPDCIINAGVAGGLDPRLHIGDMVLSVSAAQHDFDTAYFGDPAGMLPGLNRIYIPASEEMVEAMEEISRENGIPCLRGIVASGDQFIADPEKKEWIRDTFTAACTEMEGAAIAQVCWLNQVPFAILRAISDGAGDEAGMQYEEFERMAAERAMTILKSLPARLAESI